jgi:hypothetical protein
MAESFGDSFTLVEVTSDDVLHPTKQMWIALAKPTQATALVLAQVFEGWTAEIIPANLTAEQRRMLAEIKLKPGEVFMLTPK